MTTLEAIGEKFVKLVKIMAILRSEEGCPWDKSQDEKSLLNFFLEEAYELAEAIGKGRPEEVAEELGDVMMEIVFLARIYEEKGYFDLGHVLEKINQKMINRHPHVFGSAKISSPQEVKKEWAKLKTKEKVNDDPLAGVSPRMPALLEAFMLGRRASQYGFDWPSAEAALKKAEEELTEFKAELASANDLVLEEELGDLLFSLVNVCRLKRINPELILKQANKKFRRRFQLLWQILKARGKEPSQANLEEMDEIWEEIKQKEKEE
ncbi:MAG: nucleoside triphosphate pyrophosphohydrolase [Candidatus Aminicenantes bacterium]|nr:nucleoside triphosphate pyrophosphohydrolase [Candidatus Aminicenantes bacterium]